MSLLFSYINRRSDNMPAKINLTGKIFENWTVIREATKDEKNNRPGTYWYCKCKCGNEKIVSGQVLRKGESKSCGCLTTKKISEANKNRAENLIGKKFGKLLVIERDFIKEKENPNRGSTYWKCKCNCGNIISTLRSSLISGATQSCGCLRKEKSAIHLADVSSCNFIDLTGERFGKLTVLYKSNNKSKNGVLWHCKCDCGKEKDILSNSLRSNNTASCGCLGKSKGEYKIEKILLDNNINYIKEYPIKINEHNFRFDFAILQNNQLQYFIEFDGSQHYYPSNLFGGEEYFNYIKNNDKIKNEYCKNNNIPLIRIPYYKYKTLTIKDLQI